MNRAITLKDAGGSRTDAEARPDRCEFWTPLETGVERSIYERLDRDCGSHRLAALEKASRVRKSGELTPTSVHGNKARASTSAEPVAGSTPSKMKRWAWAARNRC